MSDSKEFEKLKEKFQHELLLWYRENSRKFPWRNIDNKFGIIIAEIMLQQTNAEKVIVIYPDFIEKYPNFQVLLKANNEDIIKLLSYLGLQNQRTSNLKDLADKIINKYNGDIPSNKKDLLSIKGIGDYIANAILCFAFNIRVPLLDGGIIRILERLFNIKSDKKTPRTDKKLWDKMEEILPYRNFRDFNYGLVDFAALICKERGKPLCYKCFMSKFCHFSREIDKKIIEN